MRISATHTRLPLRGRVHETIEGPVASEVKFEAPAGTDRHPGDHVALRQGTGSRARWGEPPPRTELRTPVQEPGMRLIIEGRKSSRPLHVLVVPGLGNSLDGHWQTWLQRQYARSVRVQQADWHHPDLDAWAERIEQTLALHPRTDWVAAAHSFGALALVRHLQLRRRSGGTSPVKAALLVAPADPRKFGVDQALRDGGGLGLPARLVGSTTDPWMPPEAARHWASLWGTAFTDLGDAGHINIDSGHGPWLQARVWVDELIRDQQRHQRLTRAQVLAPNVTA